MADSTPQRLSLGDSLVIQWEFERQLGSALIAYTQIESFLFTWFERFTAMESNIARRVFYSQNGTWSMIQMFRAAFMPLTFEPAETKPLLTAIVNKLQGYSSTRNLMAHGDAVVVDNINSPYHNQMIIMQGRQWASRMSDDDVLTLSGLKNAQSNFSKLAWCLLTSINWERTDHERSPDKLLQLVRLLPPVAHSTRLDPTTEERFQVLGRQHTHYR